MSLQLAIILVPVIFGLMGFALDLGRMYLVRGELNQAASAMAMAAASELNLTEGATTSAQSAALATLDNSFNDANKYNFGSTIVGQGAGTILTATTPSLSYYADLTDALSGGATVDGTAAHYVAVNLAADSPLTFWGLFSFGASQKASIAAAAVAGLSAPLCEACGIEPFAIAQRSTTDPQDFGFVQGTWYTLGYLCTGAPPAGLAGPSGAAPRVAYVVINRNASAALSTDQQFFEYGAQGLLPSTDPTQACSAVNGTEVIWAANATEQACGVAAANTYVEDAMCGLSTRFTSSTPGACSGVSNIAALSAVYPADNDVNTYADFPTYQGSYTGNNRRIVTLPIVDTVSATASMTVQGFRQFLLQPTAGTSPASNTPSDANGRFLAMYLGNAAPVKQGRFDGACGISVGPGKVVLCQ